MTQDAAYTKVERLVRKFRSLSTAQRRGYGEDNTRKDFILPLFHALEWDVYNLAEAERNLEDRRHALKLRIEEVDAAIDRMVYELYGLTEEEIAAVEGK
jgi:hypothetical protein